jgi:uncharacterized protein (DUF433 family)
MVLQSPAVDLTRYIDRRHFGERPHIRGRRIPVWVVAHAALDNPGYGVPELMYSYDLSEAEVLAALLFYEQHRDEIEAQEAAVRQAHHPDE